MAKNYKRPQRETLIDALWCIGAWLLMVAILALTVWIGINPFW